jgi:NAD(P)-dependent dehydrogenase (short-subunit alcohol dehydrogenase family)
MSASKAVLVLGAGKNIGQALAAHFSKAGYKVALLSRSATPGLDPSSGVLSLKADLGIPATISSAFASVKGEFGVFPKVVVFNAASNAFPPDENDVFSIGAEAFASATRLAIESGWVAASEAAKGWEADGIEGGRFIYTGNMLNATVLPVPGLVTLGVGKAGAAYWVQVADLQYRPKGHR